MTRDETVRLLAILRSIWPQEAVTDATLTGWTWAFEDMPYADVEAAAKTWIKTGKFFPRPAELLDLIGRAVTGDIVPETAWQEVLREVRRVGFNRLPTFRNGHFEPAPERSFSSPLIAQAVNAICWEVICTSEKPEIVYAQFTKVLAALNHRAVRDVQTGTIVDLPAVAAGRRALDGGAA